MAQSIAAGQWDRSVISLASAFIRQKTSARSATAAMAVTNDPSLAAALRELREYGWRERHVSARRGVNSRLDPIQAAILGVKLRSLEADNARRQKVADRYDTVSPDCRWHFRRAGHRQCTSFISM
jgi:dTDP-4-amino-4,6-dideoxygalactose transaminase